MMSLEVPDGKEFYMRGSTPDNGWGDQQGRGGRKIGRHSQKSAKTK